MKPARTERLESHCFLIFRYVSTMMVVFGGTSALESPNCFVLRGMRSAMPLNGSNKTARNLIGTMPATFLGAISPDRWI